MLNKNTNVKIYTSDGGKDFLDIVACVMQGDKLVQYLFVIYVDYKLRTSIDLMEGNGFTLKEVMKLTASPGNYYRRRLRRWHGTSGK